MAKRTFEDLKNKLEQLKDKLPGIWEQGAKEFSMNVKASANINAERNGIKSDSGMVETYSKNELPAYWFAGKELNRSGTTFLNDLPSVEKTNKKGEKYKAKFTTWGDFREAQGLQKAHVDLAYSNEMWRGMLPGEVSVVGTKYIAPLGHTNRDGQAKMNWNYERYGNFIINTIDLEMIKKATAYDINQKIKAILNE